jgi:hypothetical protein
VPFPITRPMGGRIDDERTARGAYPELETVGGYTGRYLLGLARSKHQLRTFALSAPLPDKPKSPVTPELAEPMSRASAQPPLAKLFMTEQVSKKVPAFPGIALFTSKIASMDAPAKFAKELDVGMVMSSVLPAASSLSGQD